MRYRLIKSNPADLSISYFPKYLPFSISLNYRVDYSLKSSPKTLLTVKRHGYLTNPCGYNTNKTYF